MTWNLSSVVGVEPSSQLGVVLQPEGHVVLWENRLPRSCTEKLMHQNHKQSKYKQSKYSTFRWICPRGADDRDTDDAWVRAGHCGRPTFAGPICGAPHGYLGLTDHRRVSVPGALPLGRCGISNIGAPSRGQCAAPQAHSALAPDRTPRADEGAVPWQTRAPSASHRQRASARRER